MADLLVTWVVAFTVYVICAIYHKIFIKQIQNLDHINGDTEISKFGIFLHKLKLVVSGAI